MSQTRFVWFCNVAFLLATNQGAAETTPAEETPPSESEARLFSFDLG